MLATALSSLVVIIVLHYLYLFLRDALTVPKIRDMVRKPQRRCSQMLHAMDAPGTRRPEEAVHAPTDTPTSANPPDRVAMQAELGAFLRDLKREGSSDGNPNQYRAESS